MNRLRSIFLVAVILLHTLGYYAVFLGIAYTHDVTMVRALDADNYDVTQTVTLKLPLAIPYTSNNNDFKRVDGLLAYQGKHYRLVKQRYADDTLTVVCVVDATHKKIQDELTGYVKTFTDKAPVRGQSKRTINFTKDYLPHSISMKQATSGWVQDEAHPIAFQQKPICSINRRTTPPPEAVC